MRRRTAALTLLLGLVGAVLLLTRPWAPSDPENGAAATLTDVSSIEEFQARFQEDQGTPRLVLLLSPT